MRGTRELEKSVWETVVQREVSLDEGMMGDTKERRLTSRQFLSTPVPAFLPPLLVSSPMQCNGRPMVPGAASQEGGIRREHIWLAHGGIFLHGRRGDSRWSSASGRPSGSQPGTISVEIHWSAMPTCDLGTQDQGLSVSPAWLIRSTDRRGIRSIRRKAICKAHVVCCADRRDRQHQMKIQYLYV